MFVGSSCLVVCLLLLCVCVCVCVCLCACVCRSGLTDHVAAAVVPAVADVDVVAAGVAVAVVPGVGVVAGRLWEVGCVSRGGAQNRGYVFV
jgi:hypothetical protein